MRPAGRISPPLVAEAAPGLPVARHVAGRSPDEVLALLPRLFNLCRAAQGAGIAAALGRPVDAGGIAAECLRDHLMKFHVTWPRFFGRAPVPLPEGWAEGGRGLLTALFGTDRAPRTAEDFAAFRGSGRALADPLRRIRDSFAPHEAVAEGLAPVTFATLWDGAPVENSVAGRHARHPVMDHVARTYGRGPLWRATARLYDIEAAALGQLPVIAAEDGRAMVPAARGAYGVHITVAEGVVTELARVTPTDALLAEGGILDRTLAALPADKAGLGPLLLDILDPCSPVRLREMADA
ncbi:hydrogenase expression/formation protein HupK [Psychromarinibacter sp. C21-152]|uniref:Hydrogenase expression/formation protein HupK n=1 Tax=Psychromarinibacter sediminicola TaxID=3033385 RepID=A0AAE3NMU7_9RHOB|nr:hydrogenase expression/formation protein HupK [Psychromarinibacter sediminicola]MDF0600223.1 hydrogenase expression/formation protein HupK [Psychromarinibacter sediminicola]